MQVMREKFIVMWGDAGENSLSCERKLSNGGSLMREIWDIYKI